MLRAIPLCLLLLLIAAPAAGAEIRIIDGVSGAGRTVVPDTRRGHEDPAFLG
jgi:hypothetical protein